MTIDETENRIGFVPGRFTPQKPKKKLNKYACPFCDAQIEITHNYCRYCGQALRWNEEVIKPFCIDDIHGKKFGICPRCGDYVKERFICGCGQRIDWSEYQKRERPAVKNIDPDSLLVRLMEKYHKWSGNEKG